MIENQQFITKIIRFLDGQSDESLKNEIMQWRFASSENEELYQQLLFLWDTSSELKDLEYLDSQSSLMRLSEKIGYTQESRPSIFWRAAMIAASVLLVFVGAWIYNDIFQERYLTIVTGSLNDSVELVDGSKVYLQANSAFKYPEKMNTDQRQVFLLKGNAFFKVAPDPSHPFVVHIDSGKVTVLGTSFNLGSNSSSIDLSVRTGKVRFDSPKGSQSSLLIAGDCLTYRKNSDQMILSKDTTGASYAWLTHELVFNDTPLSDVFKSLSTTYGVAFNIQTRLDNYSKFNASFKNSSLSEILSLLEETYGLKAVRSGKQISISKKI